MKLAYDGPIDKMPLGTRALLLDRRASFEPFVDAVRPIRDAVRARGDDALRELTARFDGWTPGALEVPRAECERALARLSPPLARALAVARDNVERFHRAMMPQAREVEVVPGLVAGRRLVPHARAGCYVPGGRATYPSTVLMTVTPAKVAGVREVVVCTPAARDGKVPDATLAACAVAGAHRVFAIGGAQAVFAMAYGTASVPRCDKLVGPGNAYVAAAKSLVAGEVAIDSPAGPSEVLVLHTGGPCPPAFAAAELLAQAEHDPEAACVLVTTDAAFGRAVKDALRPAGRGDVVAAALAKRGAILVAGSEAEAIAFSEAFAPEHLVVLSPQPRATLGQLSHYGSAFLGPYSSVALGDYVSGPNHVLPTAGLARSYSGLSVDDFLRRPTHQEATSEGLQALAEVAQSLAMLEGLPNHAESLRARRAPP
ncbi:MAG TPA: histidinol dehydrogenase [Candidatus Thermoplasmatota archaeon]|nr:histidinol dehydrogenase [Candidatus Thermoplasmatota archaeon]